MYRTSCDGNFLVGCVQLGFMLALGQGATKNEPQAIGLFRKACDGGDLRGCLGLGPDV